MPKKPIKSFLYAFSIAAMMACCPSHADPLTPAEQACRTVVGEGPLFWRSKPLTDAKAAIARQEPRVMPAYEALIAEANTALGNGPYSVTHKSTPPLGGDLHDYWSLAPYWWPDPKKADGLPYIQRDGRTNPERNGDGFDKRRSYSMSSSVVTLALAAYFSGDPSYAAHAETLLRTWFVDDATYMRPWMRYAQSIPGRTDGRAIGIIDTAPFMDLVDAVLLLDAKGILPDDLDTGLRGWFKRYVTWLTQNKMGLEERAKTNNHGTFYDAQLSTFALFSYQCGLAERVFQDTKLRIDSQIEADGSMPLELKRTRSMHYMAFNTRAYLIVARVNEHIGNNLYAYKSPKGAGIFSPLRYMLPYAARPEGWPHQEIGSTGPKALWTLLRHIRLISGSRAVNDAEKAATGRDVADPVFLLTYTSQ